MTGSDRLPVRLLVVLGALSAFGPLSTDLYLPLLPSVAHGLSSSTSAVQLTLTASVVGLGAGQLVAGPMSDSYGRRRPLLAGVAIFAIFSIGCAVAPSVPVLVGFRLLQALGGSAGLVISRAIARDLRSGPALARLFGLLMAINGVAPILAPAIGGQLAHFTTWRGAFVVLAAIGVLLLVSGALVVPESRPASQRRPGGVRLAFATYRALLADRAFVLHVFTGGLAFATMFAYISGSPFVLENVFGFSPQLFSLDFGVNAAGIIVFSLLARRIVGSAPRAVALGLTLVGLGAAAAFVGLAAGAGLPLLLPGFFLITCGFGAIAPNNVALALADHPSVAGSASAIYGAVQFLLGGCVSPLVGLRGSHDGTPLAFTLVTAAALAGLIGGIGALRARRAAVPVPG